VGIGERARRLVAAGGGVCTGIGPLTDELVENPSEGQAASSMAAASAEDTARDTIA